VHVVADSDDKVKRNNDRSNNQIKNVD